jgi:sialidase-1
MSAAAALPAVSLRAAGDEPIVTISMQPEYYHGWPTLAVRKTGDLLLVCSGGRESHICPFGRVELMRSRDGGRTWSWPEVLMDSPIDDRDAGVVETASGALLVTTFTSLAFEAVKTRTARWEAANAGPRPNSGSLCSTPGCCVPWTAE